MTEYIYTGEYVQHCFNIDWTALGILDAFIRIYWVRKFIRIYWVRKQQQLPRYRAEEILKVHNLLTMDKFTSEIERENPHPFFVNPLLIGPDFPRV